MLRSLATLRLMIIMYWMKLPEWLRFGRRVARKQRPSPRLRRPLKHPARVSDAASLFSSSKRLARHLYVNTGALDYLYARSRWANASRSEWEKAVRRACAMYRVLRRSRRLLPWDEMLGFSRIDALLDRLKSSPESPKGTLLVTFHGAFAPVAVELFRKRCAGAVTLAGGGVLREGMEAMADFKDAMFMALNALRDGDVVLMTPDGQKGRQEAPLKVLDVAGTIGEGAAFLAFTSGCNTGWYTVVREGDGFAPMFEPGPSRRSGEKFAEFSSRFHEFYARQIESIFTGDPRNIAIFGRWAKLFARAQKRNS